MQKIIIEKPYKFIPPNRGKWVSSFIQIFDVQGSWMKRNDGVISHEVRNGERLLESVQAGNGVLITPNHSRYCDPFLMGYLSKKPRLHFYAMASWHLFHQNWFNRWMIPIIGGFSVNREAADREAMSTAIDILATAERPLVIFPEGALTRTNDRVHALLDGVAVIARSAARKREKSCGKTVVVHPIAIRYFFKGDLEKTVGPVLTEIEARLSWKPQSQRPVLDRVFRLGHALLSLKELEYFGSVRKGSLQERLHGLIDRLLNPLEVEWLGRPQSHLGVVPRVKALRVKILAGMLDGQLDAAERSRRWDHLADIYLSQQISCYPSDYLAGPRVSVDRILETIERFEEDLTDKVRVHGNLHVVIDVRPAIQVTREKSRGGPDPLMSQIGESLQLGLRKLAEESQFIDSDVNAADSACAPIPDAIGDSNDLSDHDREAEVVHGDSSSRV